MLERLALKLADSFVAKGANPEDKDIYAYAIECIISSIISYGILLIAAAVLQRLPAMFVWLLFWVPLRTNIGGFHAPNHALCFIESALLGVGGVLLATYFKPDITVILLCLLVSIVVTFLIAPVIHPNHPVSEKRRVQGIKIVRIIVVAESILTVLLFFLLKNWVASIGMFSIGFAVIFGVIGKITNKFDKQEEKKTE